MFETETKTCPASTRYDTAPRRRPGGPDDLPPLFDNDDDADALDALAVAGAGLPCPECAGTGKIRVRGLKMTTGCAECLGTGEVTLFDLLMPPRSPAARRRCRAQYASLEEYEADREACMILAEELEQARLERL